ncbi:MAG: uncharacterized protein QOI13_3128 [Paraburkholderia sp.]|jgi:uncharacterized lipoprotein YmbA|nr:uncharacterized protein [Paraburkholderia sp.]
MKSVRSSRCVRLFIRLAICAGAAALSACASSPASRFYTLGAGNTAPGAFASAMQGTASPAFLIEVPPVSVPSQVARSQLVVQTGDARVDVLEQERWASPPADEIRRALSGDLAAQLGTFDAYGAPHPNGVPVYGITVNVRRFESWLGSRAVLDAVWSVRAMGTQTVLTCRTMVQVPVAAGYSALVDGHRQAVAQMAKEIAAALPAFGSGKPLPSAAKGQCATGSQS